ncbi:hypothetical protein GF407_02205 [candidate division KSB1 bacterium]|nr:hypothetical protein [candidate division KSB1 bacterium]
MKNANVQADAVEQEINEIQNHLDEMRQKLLNNPLMQFQHDLNVLRRTVAAKRGLKEHHKKQLLERIEDVQSILDGSLLFGLEEVQRQLHHNPYKRNPRPVVERMSDMLREFFRAF